MVKPLLAFAMMSTLSLNAKATTTTHLPPPNATPSAYATPSFTVSCTACDELLRECKRLHDDCEEAIQAQSETIDMLEMQKRVQQRELESARQELNSRRSWYKQPAFLITAGVLAGFLISNQIGK